MAIDWYENPVGFVPDGSCYMPKRKPEFETKRGYFDDGRMFSYPKSVCRRIKTKASKRARKAASVGISDVST